MNIEDQTVNNPPTFGSFYRGPNDSFVPQSSPSGQYTPMPSSLKIDQNSSQTAASQLNASPTPFAGGGSKEYGSDYVQPKTQNYQSFMDMLSSQKNKYIGASLSSEPRSSTTVAKANTDIPQSVQATIDASKAGASYSGSGMVPDEANTNSSGSGWKTAMSTIQKTADSIGKAQQNLARTEYEGDVAKWEEKGKYWFDVNANLKPDLEKYMASMPSSIDALKEGSWVTSLQDGNTDTAGEYLSSVFINPAGGKSGNDTADAILNPLNILEQQGWVDEGMVNYVGGKAAEGAISGGFVGALIGIVDGVFSWNSSKDEDAKRKREAQEEYERKLEEWTYNTNKRLMDARTKRDQEIEATNTAYREKRKAEETTAKNQKITDIAAARSNMANALLNAGSVKAKNRTTRAARWSK